MKKTSLTLSAALFGLTLAALPVSAQAGLAQERDINDGLLAVGLADEIRKNCDSISGRVFKALGYMSDLEDLALARGYSKAEIDAYVKSDVEKAKMRAVGEEYLAANGVDRVNPQTFCDLGRAEIAKGSLIGQFLRAR